MQKRERADRPKSTILGEPIAFTDKDERSRYAHRSDCDRARMQILSAGEKKGETDAWKAAHDRFYSRNIAQSAGRPPFARDGRG